MDELYRDVMWQVDHMPAQEWCLLSLILTVACYVLLKSFGSAYRP